MNPGSEWPRYSAATRNQASSVDPRVQQRSRDSSCWSPSQRCSRSTWRYSACKRRVWAASPRRRPIRSAIPRDTDRAVRSEIDWPCQGRTRSCMPSKDGPAGLGQNLPQSAVGSPSGRSSGCHTPAIPETCPPGTRRFLIFGAPRMGHPRQRDDPGLDCCRRPRFQIWLLPEPPSSCRSCRSFIKSSSYVTISTRREFPRNSSNDF